MSASHHHHHHVDPDAGDAKIALAVGVNLMLTVAQIIGGVLAGSLSLIADAQMTVGYGRIEAVAALINYTILIVVALYLVYEGVLRFFEPSEVTGWIIVAIAGVALAVDLVTAALTYRMSKSSMNIRAAFLHNLADALGSVAVIVAGTLVIVFGWNWVDPLVTLLIAGYILWQAAAEMPAVIRLLMLGSPPDLCAEEVADAMSVQTGVASVHHVHLWMMGEHENALEAHVVLDAHSDPAQTRTALHSMLKERFNLSHSTLQIEENGFDCAQGQRRLGHG